jgi:hypothetical protein
LFERIDDDDDDVHELDGFGILEIVFFGLVGWPIVKVKNSFDVFKNIEEKTPSRRCRWQKARAFGCFGIRFFE